MQGRVEAGRRKAPAAGLLACGRRRMCCLHSCEEQHLMCVSKAACKAACVQSSSPRHWRVSTLLASGSGGRRLVMMPVAHTA